MIRLLLGIVCFKESFWTEFDHVVYLDEIKLIFYQARERFRESSHVHAYSSSYSFKPLKIILLLTNYHSFLTITLS